MSAQATAVAPRAGGGRRPLAEVVQMPAGERARRRVEAALGEAGIGTDGSRPWDLRVVDGRFFNRVAEDGVRGLVDSHAHGWWECDDPAGMVQRAIEGGALPWPPALWGITLERLLAMRARGARCPVAPRHRALGVGFFGLGGDPSLQYSCAAFDGASDPVGMARLKLDSILRLLEAAPGARVMSAGRVPCGDLSRLAGDFDRVVDIDPPRTGLAERMRGLRGVVRRGGLLLCQAVTTDLPSSSRGVPAGGRPLENADLPTTSDILQAAEEGFECVGMWNLGTFGIPAMAVWEVEYMGRRGELARWHGEAFARMWRLFLSGTAGIIRARRLQVVRFLFSPRTGRRRRGGFP
jgi:cyclopropane-fatty-acyl-phospholipid synthase